MDGWMDKRSSSSSSMDGWMDGWMKKKEDGRKECGMGCHDGMGWDGQSILVV